MSVTERPMRLELHEDIIVNVVNCEAEPLLANAQLSAKTIDVSASGMKVWLYVPVPQRTQVTLDMPGAGDLRLEGEVRWMEESGEIRVGVLIDEHSEDFPAWRERFSHAVESSTVVH
ncbi:MAG: PilZ domain-containing protein [Pseudomonadales bacterium]|nr:PilZ domain-containing protein [Pseudomonadales bacterium]